MLLGEHKHTLDTKKRLSLPSKFRKELGKTVVITRGFDSALFVYSSKEWKKFVEKNMDDLSIGKSDTRAMSRFILGGAVETNIDSVGRILIPDFLKDFAGLGQKVMVIGLANRVELWDEGKWVNYQSELSNNADILAEKLGENGMI